MRSRKCEIRIENQGIWDKCWKPTKYKAEVKEWLCKDHYTQMPIKPIEPQAETTTLEPLIKQARIEELNDLTTTHIKSAPIEVTTTPIKRTKTPFLARLKDWMKI